MEKAARRAKVLRQRAKMRREKVTGSTPQREVILGCQALEVGQSHS